MSLQYRKGALLPKQFDHPLPALAQSLLEEAAADSRSRADEPQDVEEPREAETGYLERPSEPRYPTRDPAEIELIFGSAVPIYGTVLDVSRSGLRIALSRKIDRGQQVKVKLHNNVIFGEVRHCRPVFGAFHAGIRISDLVLPAGLEKQHIADDPLSLYAVGKGLSVAEVIEVREHLVRCENCRARLAEKSAVLNPTRRSSLDRIQGPRDLNAGRRTPEGFAPRSKQI
jgi:hypothetical protein